MTQTAHGKPRTTGRAGSKALINKQSLKGIDLQFPPADKSGPWPTEVYLYTQEPCDVVIERHQQAANRIRQSQAPGHHIQILEHGPTWCFGRDMDTFILSDDLSSLTEKLHIKLYRTGAPGGFDYLGPGILMVYMVNHLGHLPTRSLASFQACVHKLVTTVLEDFEVTVDTLELSPGQSSFVVGGKLVASASIELAKEISFTRIRIHTNTDTTYLEPIQQEIEPWIRENPTATISKECSDPNRFLTTLVELGMPVNCQENVRMSLMSHYEKMIPSKLLIPHGDGQNQTKPPWLKVKLPYSASTRRVHEVIERQRLNTVCESAHCPNMGECWAHGTATFMINGNVCTRSCSFCAIYTGRPEKLDPDESRRVSEAAIHMNLKYVVVTAVNRDELPDGGAAQFAATIRELRHSIPSVRVEVLIPDFKGNEAALDTVFSEEPDVLNHNMETVPRLYQRVRPQARYQRSLDVLKRASRAGLITKSGFMVGLGETDEEVRALLRDQFEYGCNIVTIGQYLKPTQRHHPVVRYASPTEFDAWKNYGLSLGLTTVESGPLVRSSYHAFDSFRSSKS